MADYTPVPLVLIAEQFAKLPGIGMKTAQRLAYHVLTMPENEVAEFASAMTQARSSVLSCDICMNFTTTSTCPVCNDDRRDHSVICVVEAPKDVTVIERSGGYNGAYHVLHGLLSPMNGVGPEDLTVKSLLTRLSGDVTEVIMATNPTVEGEATATYVGRLIKPLGIKVTRLAYGLPVGASLEFADDVTLTRALENRNEI